jgi:hypothetical protein
MQSVAYKRMQTIVKVLLLSVQRVIENVGLGHITISVSLSLILFTYKVALFRSLGFE